MNSASCTGEQWKKAPRISNETDETHKRLGEATFYRGDVMPSETARLGNSENVRKTWNEEHGRQCERQACVWEAMGKRSKAKGSKHQSALGAQKAMTKAWHI